MTENRMPNKRGIQLVEPEEMKKKKEELRKEKEKTTYSGAYSGGTGWQSSRWWDKDGDDKLEDWMLD